jgi:4-amino-4-deoxy-L-arabinose transferase-like glycosyltransferase
MTWKKNGLIIICILACVRLLLVFITRSNPHGTLTLDSNDYILLSKSLELQGLYSTSDESLDFIRPPGYPLFLAVVDNPIEISYTKIVFAQLILISVAIVALTILMHHYQWSLWGFFTSLLIGLSPNIALWSLTIMSEALFTFLILVAGILVILGLKNTSNTYLCLSGLTIGFAILTRPIGIILLFIWTVLIAIWFIRVEPIKSARSKIVIFLISVLLVIIPWMWRNQILHGDFSISPIGINTIESFNFAIVLSEATGITRNAATQVLSEHGGTWGQFIWLVKNHPFDLIRSQILGVLRVFGGSEVSRWATVIGVDGWSGFGIFRNLRALNIADAIHALVKVFRTSSNFYLFLAMVVTILHTLILICFSFIGFMRKKIFSKSTEWILLACSVTVLSLVLVTGAAGQARFRVPAEPFLAILAGFGIMQTFCLRDSQNRPGESIT